MSHTDLSIIHPLDPTQLGLGGFDTCIADFLRHAPGRWQIEIVGVSAESAGPALGRRTTVDFAGREVAFLPVLREPEPDVVKTVPLSLRFVLAARIRRVRPSGRVIQFHRFESTFLAFPSSSPAALFIHNDPETLIGERSDVRWRWLRPIYWAALSRALARANRIYTVDERTPARLAGQVGGEADRFEHVPVWADPALYSPLPSEQRARRRRQWIDRLDLEEGHRLILFAGRLEGQKNLSLLLRALRLLRDQGRPLTLLLVGKGRDENRLRRLARELGLGSGVRFLAPIPRPELRALYNTADLVVCSSHFESGPRHVIEALACGTPIASTEVGLIGRVLTQHPGVGALAREQSAPALAEAIVRVLEVPRDEELKAACVEAVASYRPEPILAPIFRRYNRWLQKGSEASSNC